MNRAERRRAERNGMNRKEIIDRTLNDSFEAGFKSGMKHVIDIAFYMTAYTLNYKLGFGNKRLTQIMYDIYNNIDAYRTGHLTVDDFDTIKADMEKLGVKMR